MSENIELTDEELRALKMAVRNRISKIVKFDNEEEEEILKGILDKIEKVDKL